jgi:hypothetical protein
MTIILRPEQEQLIQEAINSGFADSPEEAIDRALDTLRSRLPKSAIEIECTAMAARRLGSFGARHGLSLDGSTIKDLLLGC